MPIEVTQPGATNPEAAAAPVAPVAPIAVAPVVAPVAAPAAPAPVVTPAAAPVGAPDTYADFTVPDGVVLAGEVREAFTGVAKELGLPQDKAQLVIDKLTPVMKATNEKATAQAKADLLAASKADKEFGGDKLEASVADAKLALEAYFTPEFKQFLNDTGLGNHPEMIRGLLKIAQPLKQDKHIPGSTVSDPKDDARRFYPNSNMNA